MNASKQQFYEYSHGDYEVYCTITGGEWRQNTYIVTKKSTKNSIIIDPGGNSKNIINYIEKNKYKVTRILLTHAHFDHVSALMDVSNQFQVICELEKNDVNLLRQAPMYALRFSNIKMDQIKNYQYFEENCREFGDIKIQSILTPGHTKGSVCYLFDGFIFTGDTFLYKLIGRTDLPGGSPNEIVESIEKMLDKVTDNNIIYSGHGKPWLAGEAKEWFKSIKKKPPVHNSFDILK